MSNLEVFWKTEQQDLFEIPHENYVKLPLNIQNYSSDQNQLSIFKQNIDSDQQNYQQFLNLGDDQYSSSIHDQLCYDNCSFLNQDQINLIQNANRDEQKEYNASNNQAVITQDQNYKILKKQKRQFLREKAKTRKRNQELANLQVKQEEESTEKSMATQVKIEEEFQSFIVINPKEQSKEKKKQMQQIRNRISAQMSRDKKKIYVTNLEENQKKLEAKLKQLEEENKKLKQNYTFIAAPTTPTKKNFTYPKKDVFKYGFAFFSFMALICSINMQNNSKTLKQVESIEQPISNTTLNSINYCSGFSNNNNFKDYNSKEKQEQNNIEVLPKVKEEEEMVMKEEPREEKVEKGTKKIKKERKQRQRKNRAIDSK